MLKVNVRLKVKIFQMMFWGLRFKIYNQIIGS